MPSKWKNATQNDIKTTSKDSLLIQTITHLTCFTFILSLTVRFLNYFEIKINTIQSFLDVETTTTFTLPSLTLGPLGLSFLLILLLWFYTQHSHLSREQDYYFNTNDICDATSLLNSGLGPLPNTTDPRTLYLDTMKRSLLNIPYCESSRPVYFYGSDKQYHLSKGFNLQRRVAGEDMPENAMTVSKSKAKERASRMEHCSYRHSDFYDLIPLLMFSL